MALGNFFLETSRYFQIPFDFYCAKLASDMYQDAQRQNLLNKVMLLAVKIICYPLFTTFFLIGRTIDWIVWQTVTPTKIHEQASTHMKTHFTFYQQKTKQLLIKKTPSPAKSLTSPKKDILQVIQEAAESLQAIKNAEENARRARSVKAMQEAKQLLCKALMKPLPEGITCSRGGNNYCISYNQTPDVVYKIQNTHGHALTYVKQADRARSMCKKERLFLLQVPNAIVIELPNGKFAVMQEKADIDGDFYYQRGLYHAFFNSVDSQDYMEALYHQLAIFVAKFKFSDVKYDNIPISRQGYVVLFDLDEDGAVKGFLHGNSSKVDGLLSDLPSQKQKEVVETARPYLSETEYQEILRSLPRKKELSKKRWKKVRSYYQYAHKHCILIPEQKIKVDQLYLCELESKERTLALILLKRINRKHMQRKNWPNLRMARLVQIEVNSIKHSLDYLFAHSRFESSLINVCNYLKKIGAIYSFKINTSNYGEKRLKLYS